LDNDNNDKPNSGTIAIDATCAPANIAFPQDLKLLNDATEITEKFIDKLHIVGEKPKPRTCAKNLGISKSALSEWNKIATENQCEVQTRGRGNYESDESKENAILRKKLRDTQDALEIFKKAIGILGK